MHPHQVRAFTSVASAREQVALPAELAAAVEAALASEAALRVAGVEEVRGDYAGAGGEPLGGDDLRAAAKAGKSVLPVSCGFFTFHQG